MNSYRETSRYILQSKYQSNMIRAWAIVIAIAILFVLGLRSSEPDTEDISLDANQIKHDVGLLRPMKLEDRGGAGKNFLNPYDKIHEGFLGFDIIIVDKERKSTNLPKVVSKDSPTLPLLEDVDIPSFSTRGGEGDGMYIPDYDYDTYFGDARKSEDSGKAKLTRPVQIIKRSRPVYPNYAKRNGIEGVVKVLIHVGVTGEHLPINDYYNGEYITDKYLVVYEEPKGYQFADSFLELLPLYVFSPAITDGIPIDAYIVVSWKYCQGYNCYKEMMGDEMEGM